jgi:hypothetical protein
MLLIVMNISNECPGGWTESEYKSFSDSSSDSETEDVIIRYVPIVNVKGYNNKIQKYKKILFTEDLLPE